MVFEGIDSGTNLCDWAHIDCWHEKHRMMANFSRRRYALQSF